MSIWTKKLRGTIQVASMLTVLSAGIGIATAQPGAEFQDRGIREDLGLSSFGPSHTRRPSGTVHFKSYSYRGKQRCPGPSLVVSAATHVERASTVSNYGCTGSEVRINSRNIRLRTPESKVHN